MNGFIESIDCVAPTRTIFFPAAGSWARAAVAAAVVEPLATTDDRHKVAAFLEFESVTEGDLL
ncbi:hypothetical protein AB0J43_24935, partial [Nonomuraea fuscirosea]